MKSASAFRIVATTAGVAGGFTAREDEGLDRVAAAERKDVVVVFRTAGGAQHDEIAAAGELPHAHVIVVDVVAAALEHPEAAGRGHDVRCIAGQEPLHRQARGADDRSGMRTGGEESERE